jgi:hypothetical protein
MDILEFCIYNKNVIQAYDMKNTRNTEQCEVKLKVTHHRRVDIVAWHVSST